MDHAMARIGTTFGICLTAGWLTLIGGSVQALSAQTLYVAPTGNDGSPGTITKPLRTVAEAARRARAGEIVLIMPGTYEESVRVVNSGTPGMSITFQAEETGTVVITGENGGFQPSEWAGDNDDYTKSGNPWVTLRGLVFRNIGVQPAVRASTGWHIDDCRFEQVGFGVNVRGNDVVIEKSVFRDINSTNAHAVVGVSSRNLRLSDLVIQRINQRRDIAEVANSSVTKFVNVSGLTVERVISEDNVGPGLWIDTNNRNFIVRDSVFRRNKGSGASWEGPGIWIELNDAANGQIYRNTIIGNGGAGIEVMESNGIAIHDNIILDNPACIAFRNMPRGNPQKTFLGAIHVHENLCGGWSSAGIATGIGDWEGFDVAKDGILIDRNRYLSSTGAPLMLWLDKPVTNLDEAAERLGFERNGMAQ
jgi:parallel beta-helix repeat protein